MARSRQNGGCLGCATVLILLLVLVGVFATRLAPPMVRNVLEAYRLRLLNVAGMYELEDRYDDQELGFSGKQLSEGRQLVYLQLLDGIQQRHESFAVFEAQVDDIDPAYKAVMRDHPELFWLDGSCAYVYSKMGDVVTVTPGLSVSLEEVPAIEERLQEVADTFLATLPSDASEYDVMRAAYEYIISTTDYVVGSDQSQNIQSVLLNHESVCAGYARTYQYLLQRAGVFCAFVEGSISGAGEDHAWNLVRADDVYAYVDTTWGDPTYKVEGDRADNEGIIYDYLGITTEEMLRDQHVFATTDELPDCTSHDLDYYQREGMVFDAYDEQALSASFASQMADGSQMAAFKFSDEDAYRQAVQALEAGEFLTDELLNIAASRGDTRMQYSYVVSDSLRIAKVYW